MANDLISKLTIKDENAKQVIKSLQGEIKTLQATCQALGKEAKSSAKNNANAWKLWGDSLKSSDSAMGKFQRGLADIDKNFGGVISKLGVSIPQLVKFGSVVGAAAAAGAAFVNFSQQAVAKSSEFGKSISELGGITGASGKDLDKLRGMIQDLAVDTNTSSKEVSGNFAQIGSALPELLHNAKGLEAVSKSAITLSKAGVMPLAEATDSLTVSMAQFGLSSDDAAHVTDVLANAAQKGSAGIKEVAETLQRAGTMANSAGVSITEAAAATEVLASKGIKGAEAGTALKGVFSKMQTKGIDEINPKVVGMATALENLHKHAEDATWMVQTFGESNASAAQILASNVDLYKELAEQLDATGTAEMMAKQNTDNLASDWSALQVQWENLLSSFNVDGANNPFREVVQGITEMVKAISGWFSIMGDSEMNEAFGNIDIDPLRELFGIFTDLINAIKAIDEALGISDKIILTFQAAWKGLGVVVKAVREVFFLVEVAVSAVAKMVGQAIKLVKDFFSDVTTTVKSFPFFETLSGWIDSIISGLKEVVRWYRTFRGEAAKMIDAPVNKKKEEEEKKEEEKEEDKPEDKPNTPNPPTPNTTTQKSDPIKEAEEKYADTIRKLALQEADGIIEHKKAEESRFSALNTLMDVYYSQKKLTKAQNETLKGYIKALSKAKDNLTSLSDDQLYEDALRAQSRSIQIGWNQQLAGYITEEQLKKIEEDARDKLIQALFQLKAPSEEQTQLLQNLIDVQNKSKQAENAKQYSVDKINLQNIFNDAPLLNRTGETLINHRNAANKEKVSTSVDIWLEDLKKRLEKKGVEVNKEFLDELRKQKLAELFVENFRKDLERIQKNGQTTGANKPEKLQNRGDDSNLVLTNKSYTSISKETDEFLQMPKTISTKAQFEAAELDKALEKYQQIEDIINQINEKRIGESTDGMPELIVYSDELDQLEKDIEKMRKKVRRNLNFEIGMDGFNDVLSGLSSLEGFAENIYNLGDAWENASTGLEKFGLILNTLISAFQAVQTVMTIINGLQTLFGISTATTTAALGAQTTASGTKQAADLASVGTATAATAAAKVETEAMLSLAAATIMAAHSYIPFAGVAIGSAQVGGMLGAMGGFKGAIAALAAFANGGIVGGTSFSGDQTIIRANAGEMILNRGQQTNLFNLLDNGASFGKSSQVEFIIQGSTLKGCLNNYDKKMSKIK